MHGIELRRTSAEASAEHRRAMESAISELYTAFRHRELSPDGPDVCTGCCVEPEQKERLATTPKHAIALDDLSTFHYAAKGDGAGQDIAYFLPRTLEFVSQGSDLLSAGLFCLFSYCPSVWAILGKQEQQALQHFCSALSRWRFGLVEDEACEFTMLSILEMCSNGGFDVTPVMKVIADPPPTFSSVRIIADMLLNDVDVVQERGCSGLQITTEVAKQLGIAVSSPAVLALLEAGALQNEDSELSGRASMAHWIVEQVAAEQKGD